MNRFWRQGLYVTVFALWAFLPATARPQAAPVTTTGPGFQSQGYEVIDPVFGIKVLTANQKDWDAEIRPATDYARLVFKHYPDKSQVSFRKSYSRKDSAQASHDESLDALKAMMPGAIFWAKGQKIDLGGVEAVSSTYKDPSNMQVTREVHFRQGGQNYEMVFTFDEKNFETVKAEFSYLLKNTSFVTPSAEGGQIKDLLLGIGFKAPAGPWSLRALIDGVELSRHDKEEDFTEAVVQIYKPEFAATTLEIAYDELFKERKEKTPKMILQSEKIKLKVAGNVDALSFIYQHPTKRMVNREIVLMHRGQPLVLSFSFAESRYEIIKPELIDILNNRLLLF